MESPSHAPCVVFAAPNRCLFRDRRRFLIYNLSNLPLDFLVSSSFHRFPAHNTSFVFGVGGAVLLNTGGWRPFRLMPPLPQPYLFFLPSAVSETNAFNLVNLGRFGPSSSFFSFLFSWCRKPPGWERLSWRVCCRGRPYVWDGFVRGIRGMVIRAQRQAEIPGEAKRVPFSPLLLVQ